MIDFFVPKGSSLLLQISGLIRQSTNSIDFMNPFRSDIKLTDFLKQNGFTSSAEIIPPRNGSEQRKDPYPSANPDSCGPNFSP